MKKRYILICLVVLLMWQPMPQGVSQSTSPVAKPSIADTALHSDQEQIEEDLLDKIDSNNDSIISQIKSIADKQTEEPKAPVELKPLRIPVIIRDTTYQHDTLILTTTNFIEGPSLKPEEAKPQKKRSFLRRLFNKK